MKLMKQQEWVYRWSDADPDAYTPLRNNAHTQRIYEGVEGYTGWKGFDQYNFTC